MGSVYGVEKLIVGKRDFTGPFANTITEFRRGDISWEEEWLEFDDAVSNNRQPIGNGEDGLAVMKIALASYESESKKEIYITIKLILKPMRSLITGANGLIGSH